MANEHFMKDTLIKNKLSIIGKTLFMQLNQG